MSHQHGRPILPRQNSQSFRHRVLQRRQRVLHGGGVQPGRLQPCDHVGPARPVREQPVDEDDVRAAGPVSVRAQRGVSAAAAPVAIVIANKRRSIGEPLLQPTGIDAASDHREALRAVRQPENSTQRVAAAMLPPSTVVASAVVLSASA